MAKLQNLLNLCGNELSHFGRYYYFVIYSAIKLYGIGSRSTFIFGYLLSL